MRIIQKVGQCRPNNISELEWHSVEHIPREKLLISNKTSEVTTVWRYRNSIIIIIIKLLLSNNSWVKHTQRRQVSLGLQLVITLTLP